MLLLVRACTLRLNLPASQTSVSVFLPPRGSGENQKVEAIVLAVLLLAAGGQFSRTQTSPDGTMSLGLCVCRGLELTPVFQSMDVLQSEELKGLADSVWLLTGAVGFSENLQNYEPAPSLFFPCLSQMIFSDRPDCIC